MPPTRVVFENEQYVGEALSPEERALLEMQIRNDFAAPGSFYEMLLMRNLGKVIGAGEVAKDKFKAPFTGMSAGDSEFGMQKIRAGHIMRTAATTETCANTWSFTLTTSTDYLVGYSTNNTTAINIDKEALVLLLGVVFTQGAGGQVEELYVQVGSTTYPVISIRDAWMADNDFGVRGVPIRPILLIPKATVLIQTLSIAANVAELVFLGVTFGMGRYLRQQTYSTVST